MSHLTSTASKNWMVEHVVNRAVSSTDLQFVISVQRTPYLRPRLCTSSSRSITRLSTSEALV